MELGPSNGITLREAVCWNVYLKALNRNLKRSLLKSQWSEDPKKTFYQALLQQTRDFRLYPDHVYTYYKWVKDNQSTGVKITPVKVNLKKLRIPPPVIKITKTKTGWNQQRLYQTHEIIEVTPVIPVIQDVKTITIEEFNLVSAKQKRLTKGPRKFLE